MNRITSHEIESTFKDLKYLLLKDLLSMDHLTSEERKKIENLRNEILNIFISYDDNWGR